MKLRRGDETSWIWGRSAYELRHLSHLVRLKLPEYNQEKAAGMATVADGEYFVIGTPVGIGYLKIYCGNPQEPLWKIYATVAGSLMVMIAACAASSITAFVGCIGTALLTTVALEGMCGYWKVCYTVILVTKCGIYS